MGSGGYGEGRKFGLYLHTVPEESEWMRAGESIFGKVRSLHPPRLPPHTHTHISRLSTLPGGHRAKLPMPHIKIIDPQSQVNPTKLTPYVWLIHGLIIGAPFVEASGVGILFKISLRCSRHYGPAHKHV